VFTGSASNWNQTEILTSSDDVPGDKFGSSVAINGNTIVVEALDATTTYSSGPIPFPIPGPGAAYLFTGSGSDWTQNQKLTASDGAEYDSFGSSVAISGDTIVIGAPGTTVGGIAQGAAYTFTESGSNWNLSAELSAPNGEQGAAFGSAITIDGSTYGRVQ
jgi:hypothetical protein